MAVFAVIFGIIAIVSMGTLIFPEILGIVFATKGKKQGVMRPEAKAGMVCSIISIIILVIAFVVGMII